MTIPVTRDTWVSSVGEEQEGNNGASSRLKFKGIQEFSLLDGDFSALKGRRIERAVLRLHQASEERLWQGDGLDDLHPLGGRHGNELRQAAQSGVFPLAGRRAGYHGGHSRQRRVDLEIRRRLGPRCRRVAVDPRRPGRDPGAARRTQLRVCRDGRRGQRVDPPGRSFSLAAVAQPLLLLQGPERRGGPAVRGLGDGRPAGGGASARPLRRCCAEPEEDRSAFARHARGGKGRLAVDGRRRSVRPAAGGPPCGAGRDGVAGSAGRSRRKPELRVPDGFSGRLFSVEAHGDALVPCDASGKPSLPERTDRHRRAGHWLAEISRPQVGPGRAVYGSTCPGMRRAAGGVGLRPARPALVRPADECLRAARRAGDRLLPPGPRASELPELPAVLVARARLPTAARRKRLPADRGTGRPGTAASGRSWTVPPSPICPAGRCRSRSSTSR